MILPLSENSLIYVPQQNEGETSVVWNMPAECPPLAAPVNDTLLFTCLRPGVFYALLRYNNTSEQVRKSHVQIW